MVNGMRARRCAQAGVGALVIAATFLAAPIATADPVDSAEPAPQAVADVTAVPVSVSTAPADGVPHLPSPDNLPPGTTQASPESANMSYLRYLWQAVRTPGVTMSDALILIAQRPLDSKSAPNSSTTVAPAPAVTTTEATVVTVEAPTVGTPTVGTP